MVPLSHRAPLSSRLKRGVRGWVDAFFVAEGKSGELAQSVSQAVAEGCMKTMQNQSYVALETVYHADPCHASGRIIVYHKRNGDGVT